MNTVKINNEMNLTYPDGFHEMGEEELIKYFGTPANRWGLYDADKHIILSVAWTKGGFFSAMTDAESVLFGMESRMRRNLLNYQRIGSFKMKIASKKAQGIRFEYRVDDAALVQVGDLFVFKYNKKFYTIHYITRKTNAADTRLQFKEILDSITMG